ncbi:hypothetical protein TcasGA2_TC012589 [Tribolium castaneum]|uniref:Uncharacterized protein n=1 Tax=Tribolium castaneum TaxID=7070 RepID=D6X3D1_TRICA|nr:hypothetical protein TcasGA2_TC012589 [Tribolium castaneum]
MSSAAIEVQREVASRLEKDGKLCAKSHRSASEQGPHPGYHLWGTKRSRKRTSAPQMGAQPRTALILRSRRSWPVAPVASSSDGKDSKRNCQSEEIKRPRRARSLLISLNEINYGRLNSAGDTLSAGWTPLGARGRHDRADPQAEEDLCCLPWCGPAEGKAAPPSPPVPPFENPIRARQPSPHLQDIAEEESFEDDDDSTACLDEEQATLQPLAARLSYKNKRRNVQSPSPTLSVKASRKGQRTRSVTSTTSSEGSSTTTVKMQAEQGSIGELQKYHNRYLRNRRHTLANVR